ncbi:RIPOR family member 3 [Amia ocellicauda]|uniref:RIPOR family member 3 n=1 Tax=Amia ocellicauda TaxID=2972642 RepID=UPI0034648FAC
MSVKLRFECPAEGGTVTRSRSFAGFSVPQSRRARISSVRSSMRSRGSPGKSPRIQSSSSRGALNLEGAQPEQVEQVFQVLRRGLTEYLLGHQAEMDFLTAQQKDSKRNSRLAFHYDLEKEIRALERYLRRLEFHISKVEELCEAYCIQWRLWTGAGNMKRAFALSPNSRAARESLQQLSRCQRQSVEDMCLMEGELETLLGELHIRMKGLIGFARLCPGDQYEVQIRLGRQRWKIKGKIQSDDQQSWDEEEMVFLPQIQENFEIKVMEVRGLSSVLVGVVTCESADFFQARPQTMVVDITELGTIKLQLELLWDPFDNGGEMRPVTGSVSKLSAPSRKGSLYNWTPPSTPSFTEKYFMPVVQRFHPPEHSLHLASRESREVSLLSYLTDTSHSSLSPPFREDETPSAKDRAGSWPAGPGEQEGDACLPEDGTSRAAGWTPGQEAKEGSSAASSPLPVQRYSTPDILKQNGGTPPAPRDTDGEGPDADASDRLSFTGRPDRPEQTAAPSAGADRRQQRNMALRIGQLLGELGTCVHSQARGEKELRRLETQILNFRDILKNDLYLHKTCSTETLAVEEVLGSFDFLSTDFSADELSCLGSMRRDMGISSFGESTLRRLGLLPAHGEAPPGVESLPLTTGSHGLDCCLEIHLLLCGTILQQIKNSNSPLVQCDLLEELSLQVDVLDKIGKLSLEKNVESYSAKDLVPKSQRLKGLLSFWNECTDCCSVYCCPVETFLKTLRKRFIHRVKAKQPGQVDAVFAQMLQQIVHSCRGMPVPQCCRDQVTVFQFFNYLSRCGLTDFGEHLSHLAKEVRLIGALQSPKRRRALERLRGSRLSELQPLAPTLQLLASLQIDTNTKVSRAAATCLSRTTAMKTFRAKAVLYYTERLRDDSAQVQQAACLALKCLKASESVEQIADLWRSEDEDVRNAAREAVLSFGKKGHLAFQRMDRICQELQEEALQNSDTEITIL